MSQTSNPRPNPPPAPATANARVPWDPTARPPPAPPPPRAAARPMGTADVTPDGIPSPIGKTYGRYRILSVIQRGGMGEIFLAEIIDGTQYGQQVVLKRLLADFDDDERYRSMFGAEARVMLRMDHANIVKVFDAPMIEGKPCLAMEFVHGRNVSQILKRAKKRGIPMPPQLAVAILLEVLEGLQYAHSMVLEDGRSLDLVHRDVTPGNILVSFDGAVKITDFGIAKSKMSVVSTTVGVVKGTTRYLSPEQIRSENVDGRSDIFSSATVLTEMLTGTSLFDRGAVPPTLFAIIKGQRKPIADLLPFPAPRLAAALERALSVSPRDRFRTAAEFAAALRETLPELGRAVAPGALGRFVQELFDDQKITRPKPTPGPENPSLDLTYLFEVNEGSGAHAVRDVPAVEPTPVSTAISGGTPLSAEEFVSPPPRFPSARSDSARAAPPPPPPVSRRIELPEFPDVVTSPSRSLPISDVGIEAPLDPIELMEAVALELDANAPPPPRFPPMRTPSGVNSTPSQLKAPYRPTPSRLPADLFREPGTHDVAVEEAMAPNVNAMKGVLHAVAQPVESAPTPDTFDEGRRGPSTAMRVLFLAGTLCGACLVWGMTVFFSEVPVVREVRPTPAQTTKPAQNTQPAPAPAEPSPGAASRATFDLERPRGARVFVDGIRLKKRVPIRGFEVEPGHREILVTKGEFQRWIEIEARPGQHFDLTDPTSDQ